LLEQELVLIEAMVPAPESLVKIAEKRLAHGNLRPPLAIFEERVGGDTRYCMVIPQVAALESPTSSSRALKRGVQLARGLDYLHSNGITFHGKIDPACFALDGDRAVWADFNFNHLDLQSDVEGQSADVRSLARIVFMWRSGKADFEPDPNLVPVENQLFETALTNTGYPAAWEFASAIEKVLSELVTPQAVDYRLGRRSHVGMLRNLNEDSMLTLEMNRTQQSFSQPLGLYVVADGLGGHTAGEIASGAIVNSFSDKALCELMRAHLSQQAGKTRSEWLREAVQEANTVVFNLRKSSQTDMGSTLVAAVLEGSQAYIAHVGDSRAYLINSAGIRQLTTDHSLVERLVATNQISREEARYHPQRNVIYRTIGDKKEVDVETSTHTLKPGDTLLLCSDGLSGMVEDRIIQQIVRDAESVQAACDQLIEAANAAGGEDNITAIVVKIVQA
jgi:serine/threonine protein phosphatase PrpC